MKKCGWCVVWPATKWHYDSPGWQGTDSTIKYLLDDGAPFVSVGQGTSRSGWMPRLSTPGDYGNPAHRSSSAFVALKTWCLAAISLMLLLTTTTVQAQTSVEALQKQLQEQRELIEQQKKLLDAQQKQLEQQSRQLDNLGKRINQIEQTEPVVASPQTATGVSPAIAASKTAAPALPLGHRDPIGDLNAKAVQAGTFPGSLQLPGTHGVSLAIGGFIRTVSIYDSNAEKMGADFLPATMSTRSTDHAGAFSIDSTLTRMDLDARAPVADGELRGYIEWDLNDNNDGTLGVNLRHAYGSWANSVGTLTAGHTWSTFMDLGILPESLTEPTMSGAVFTRQSLIRWSQPFGSGWIYHVALEDPGSNDFTTNLPNEVGSTSRPDIVVGLQHDWGEKAHIRLNGLARHIEVRGNVSESDTGWGLALTGHVKLFDRDRLNLGAVYGQGVGRYLLGLAPGAGVMVDQAQGLQLRDNMGALATYYHPWSKTLRSTVIAGYAKSKPEASQGAGTFKSSQYNAVNLMWSPYPYLTVGVEYDYGNLKRRGEDDLNNNRISVGFQFY